MAEQIQLGEIPVDVIFKDIKNVHLSVHPPMGRVRISAPRRMDLDTIRVFAISKLQWIKDQRKKFVSQPRETQREMLERESHYLWGKRYLMELFERHGRSEVLLSHEKLRLVVPPNSSVHKKLLVLDNFYRQVLSKEAKIYTERWEERLGVSTNRIFIQKMKTKWGSCNPTRRNIRLNLELAKKPLECLDYVVLHELLHFFVPNHGPKFIALIDGHMPHWRFIRQKLNEAPLSHTEWA